MAKVISILMAVLPSRVMCEKLEGGGLMVVTPPGWLGVAAIHFYQLVIGLAQFEPLISVHRWVILVDADCFTDQPSPLIGVLIQDLDRPINLVTRLCYVFCYTRLQIVTLPCSSLMFFQSVI